VGGESDRRGPPYKAGLHPLGPERSGGCEAQAKHCRPPRRA